MIQVKSHTPLIAILVLLIIFVSSAVTVKPVHAATIYVNTTTDENTNNANCSLREAIIAANTNSFYNGCTGGSVSGDVISLPSGTYTLTSALPAITTDIEIRRDGVTNPIVQANSIDPNLSIYRVFEVQLTGTLNINGLVVKHGRCTGACATSGSSGGGIYNAGTLYVNESTVTLNYVSGDGGGIYNAGDAFISNSTISGNLTYNKGTGAYYEDGGGIYNADNATLQLTNSTISGNQAYYGGGIFSSTGSTLSMYNCTVSNNSGRQPISGSTSGGIYIYKGTINFTNTIIANSSWGDCYINTGVIGTNVNNLVENGSCSPFLSGDPELSALRDNGGPTYTHALLIGSIAIDTGDATACPGTDQRRIARPQGLGCDIGAYEQEDFTAPTSLSIVVSDPALRIGETSLVTFTFDEAVTGFTNADLVIENGTLSNVSSADGGVNWTATLTPDAEVEDAANQITLDMTGVTDLVGNPGIGTANSNTYAIDTIRLTATIEVQTTSLAIGDTSKVSITFSEPVESFTVDDLEAENGILSGFITYPGDTTWAVTLSPDPDVEDDTNVITLDNTNIRDLAGNPGLSTTDSNNYVIDTLRLTLTIDVNDTSLIIGDTSLVTFTFSEGVVGFSNADLTIQNATLGDVSSSDGGVTWTATLTPDNGVEDNSNVITIVKGGVSDLAGNAGSGTTDSNNYAIDTTRPSATIVVSDTVLIIGDTSLVTFTFSEEVDGFTNDDLTVPNGTLSSVSSSDHGITWTATLTPSAGISDPTNVIVLNMGGVRDVLGNSGSGMVNSNNYVIDTIAPNVTIEQDEDQADPTDSSPILFTVTFSEAIDPASFTPPDVTLEGTAGATSVAISEIVPNNGTKFTLTVSGMTGDGTVIVSMLAGVVEDMAGNVNTASMSKDNVVTYDTKPPYMIFLPMIIRN